MSKPAAKQGDKVQGQDTHLVKFPGTPPVITALPFPFEGNLDASLCASVQLQGKAAAVVSSRVSKGQAHTAPSPGTFVNEPSLKATVVAGSGTVFFGGKPA